MRWRRLRAARLTDRHEALTKGPSISILRKAPTMHTNHSPLEAHQTRIRFIEEDVARLRRLLSVQEAQLEKAKIAQAQIEVKQLTKQLQELRARQLPQILLSPIYLTKVKSHYRRLNRSESRA